MPVVSIVMPVYRRAEYLPTAIESILNQTFGDFELICVDGRDGGEECRDVIEDYAAKDVRVKYMVQGGIGVSDARNTGLNYASGEYFAVHDSDDISNPQRLQKQVDFLKNNQDYAAVVGRIHSINEAGKVTCKDLNFCKDPGRSDALCYRSAALTAGGYRPFFINSEDADFGFRFLEKGFVTKQIKEELYLYRVHSLYRITQNDNDNDTVTFLKYLCAVHYCVYCRKMLGKDPVDEGKRLEEMLQQLGGIHLLIKDCYDESIIMSRFKTWEEQSFSRFLIGRCERKVKHAMWRRNYSNCVSMLQFMENYLGVDEMSRKHVRRIKIKLLWQALKNGHLGYFRDAVTAIVNDGRNAGLRR